MGKFVCYLHITPAYRNYSLGPSGARDCRQRSNGCLPDNEELKNSTGHHAAARYGHMVTVSTYHTLAHGGMLALLM